MKVRKIIYLIGILILGCNYQTTSQKYPPKLDHLGFSYDKERDKIVLFGGTSVNEDGKYTWNSTTWEWDKNGWNKKNDSTPGYIGSMSMIYDEAARKTLVMGGINPAKGDLDETWIWNGKQWEELKDTSPGIRLSPAMAYDKANKEIVLFSGCIGNNYTADTWIYSNGKWSKREVSGPEGVCRAAMFFDEVRQKVVLFGGAKINYNVSDEMWEWDGEKWTKVNQGSAIPEGRSNILIAYDENRKKAVLFGGSNGEKVLGDLWEWDGRSWTEVEQGTLKPGPREIYGITYHNKLKKIFLYGGRTRFADPKSDFWSWDGTAWKRIQ